MKQISFRLALVVASLLALPGAHAAPLIRVSDPSICIDGMVTDPDSDELVPILAAVDSGCTISVTPVSI